MDGVGMRDGANSRRSYHVVGPAPTSISMKPNLTVVRQMTPPPETAPSAPATTISAQEAVLSPEAALTSPLASNGGVLMGACPEHARAFQSPCAHQSRLQAKLPVSLPDRHWRVGRAAHVRLKRGCAYMQQASDMQALPRICRTYCRLAQGTGSQRKRATASGKHVRGA